MNAPEVYQVHRACLRYSIKGKRTSCILALSTTKMYLLNPDVKNLMVAREIAGTCTLKEVESYAIHTNCDTLITIVAGSSLTGGTGKIKVDIMIRFFNTDDCQWL